MSYGVNKAIIVGNLCADGELKFTNGGQAVLKLRVAATESVPSKDGQRQDRTEFITVTLWGKRAEALNKILAKGRTIYVEGRIQTRSWEDKNGNKRYATEINATELVLLPDGKGRGGEQRQQSNDDHGYGPGATDDDQLPFAPVMDQW